MNETPCPRCGGRQDPFLGCVCQRVAARALYTPATPDDDDGCDWTATRAALYTPATPEPRVIGKHPALGAPYGSGNPAAPQRYEPGLLRELPVADLPGGWMKRATALASLPQHAPITPEPDPDSYMVLNVMEEAGRDLQIAAEYKAFPQGRQTARDLLIAHKAVSEAIAALNAGGCPQACIARALAALRGTP
jgi:hypothetical protein